MRTFSKILTLNKLHIIENIIETVDGGSLKADYFNIGFPVGNPPLLRGSIVIELNMFFLTDNGDYFNIGSPVDTGSINFGFLKPNCDKNSFLDMISCDYEKFHALTSELFSLSDLSVDKLNNHKSCPSFKPILEKYFTKTVVDFMYSESNPHAWLFEFCLDIGYVLAGKHIKKVFIPNTYASNPMMVKLKSLLKDKVVQYNPKYGIEGREY